jgi:putative peptidoglycan lipid II flippase
LRKTTGESQELNEAAHPPSDALRIQTKSTVAGAAVLMAVMILASRVSGLIRQLVIVHLFGVSWETGAYESAFNIPDFIYFLISGGALATGFVPVFTEYLAQGDQQQARRTFRAMGTLLSVLLLVAISLCWTFAYQLVWLTSPGYRDPVRARELELTVNLTRILLPCQFFFVLGGLFAGTLNSLRYFFFPMLQPIIYNFSIMLGGLTSYHLNGSVNGLAWGALVGALSGAFVCQVPVLLKVGMSFHPLWDLRDPGVRKILTLVAPIILGLSIQQINALLLPRSMASSLPEGAVMVIGASNRLMQIYVAVFASSVAIALLPSLSMLAARKELDQLREAIGKALRVEMLLSLPSAVVLWTLGMPIVRLVYEHGQFNTQDTQNVTYALMFYAFGIWAMSTQQIVSRGYYALQDSLTPMLVGLAGIATFAVSVKFLIAPLGYGAPALASSLAAMVTAALLTIFLRKRLGGIEDKRSLFTFLKCALATVALGAACWFSSQFLEHALPIQRKWAQLAQVAASLALGIGVYAFLLRLLRVQEVDVVWERVRKKLRRSTS